MPATTIALNKNVASAKKLVGIAKFIQLNSEAFYLSQGNDIITTEREIRDTKKAQVLIPLLTDVIDVKTVLSQGKDGGVKSEEIQLNEFIVELANEKITKPKIVRARDLEVIKAQGLTDAIASSYRVSATVAKDKAFYNSLILNAKNGVEVAVGGTSLKGQFLSTVLPTNTDFKGQAFHIADQLRQARNRIKNHKDKLIQQGFRNQDIVFVINTEIERLLQADARYNMQASKAIVENAVLDAQGTRGQLSLNVEVANFDGSPVIVSKQLPAGIDFIAMIKGSATSLFMLRNEMNFDKIPGVSAYVSSMEFDEGTGVWLPQLITIGTNNLTTYPVQAALGFDAYDISMNNSTTVSGNKANSGGII